MVAAAHEKRAMGKSLLVRERELQAIIVVKKSRPHHSSLGLLCPKKDKAWRGTIMSQVSMKGERLVAEDGRHGSPRGGCPSHGKEVVHELRSWTGWSRFAEVAGNF